MRLRLHNGLRLGGRRLGVNEELGDLGFRSSRGGGRLREVALVLFLMVMRALRGKV